MRTIENIRRFRLSDTFVEPYREATVPWGPIGYITYKRTYSRRLSEFDPGASGSEEWWQTCRRVVEGMFNMQKQHVFMLGLEWNDNKAQKTAKEAYERLFNLKWTPPGRGLWMMGTKFVEERTAAGLFNCAFRSTRDLANKGGYLFAWMMDALMVGVGVGFDTEGAGTLSIKEPSYTNDTLVIDDSREGWVDSVHVLLDGFFFGGKVPKFDYSAIRPLGAEISTFGGTSSGPAPLIELHKNLTELFSPKIGEDITSVDIVDTENLIGRCVVSGNVRRSAALAMGRHDDQRYLEMKNDQ
jgi:ribonucleoside-triphosphate reductase